MDGLRYFINSYSTFAVSYMKNIFKICIADALPYFKSFIIS